MGPNDKAICVRGGRDMVSTGSGVLRMEIWQSERRSGHSPGTNKIGFLRSRRIFSASFLPGNCNTEYRS